MLLLVVDDIVAAAQVKMLNHESSVVTAEAAKKVVVDYFAAVEVIETSMALKQNAIAVGRMLHFADTAVVAAEQTFLKH